MKRGRSESKGRTTKKVRYDLGSQETVFTETSTAVLPRSIAPRGMPKRMYVKQRYFEQVTVDPAAGGATAVLFRLNSGFDPYFSGVGRQPKGLDQYFALYDKCVVTSSKIVVKAVGPAGTIQGVFGVSLRNDTGVDLTVANYVEDPSSVHAIANIYDPNQEVVIKYTPKWFGDSKTESAQEDDELHFSAGADASKQCYAHCFFGALQSGHDPTAVWLQVFIEYNFCFFEPNTLPLS
jgi:hypothetical protein